MALLETLHSCFKENLSQHVIAVSHSQPIITLRDGYQIKTEHYDVDLDTNDAYVLCHFAF